MPTYDDSGATRATNPTRASNVNGPYVPPTTGERASSATVTGPVIEHTEHPAHVTGHHSTEQVTSGSQERRDRVRWGPIWAGVAAVLTVFVVLQLLFFALGWLDLGFNGGSGSSTTAAIVTGVLALIAFFVGGLLAGASTMWRGAGDGLLHGVLVWALSVLGILALALLGGSALLGPLAQLASSAPDAAQAAGQAAGQAAQTVDPAQALDTARRTAGGTALGLGLAVAAAAIGGSVGSKIWPGKNKDHDSDTRNDHRAA
jgi:hypothetical protein